MAHHLLGWLQDLMDEREVTTAQVDESQEGFIFSSFGNERVRQIRDCL